MFKTIIGVPAGETANVRRVCEDIKKKDNSFKYELFEPSVIKLKEKFETLLILILPTKVEANRWGGWFIHKVRDAKLADYFWVNEF